MIPSEVLIPIKEFFKKNSWVIIILIIIIFAGYASLVFLELDNQVEFSVDKIIE